MADFQLDDISISYEVQGNGVTLVFVHEVATDHRLWLHQNSYFYQRYRMITVDLFGHGKVAWPKHQISSEQGAHGIRNLLERLGTPPVFIIGVSIGADRAPRSHSCARARAGQPMELYR